MKKYLFTLALAFSVFIANGQVNDSLKVKTDSVPVVKVQPAPVPANPANTSSVPLKKRIAFGFGGSLWFTASQTYIEVAPIAAYRFPRALIAGVGYRYIYRHDRVIDRNLNSYGPDFFARLNLIPKIYIWSEYEILYNQYYTVASDDNLVKNSTSTDALFAGLGYSKSVGRKGKGGISIQLLYNFLYKVDDINPYYSPVTYRVGYFF